VKILFTHRYFWPDSPAYAAMLRAIAEHAAAQGHEVEVFASQPSYGEHGRAAPSERMGGIAIRRVGVFRERKGNPLARGLNVVIYCAHLFLHVLRSRPDVVTAATFPPVIAGWTGSLAAKLTGAKFIYHLQDVHPEVSVYSGGVLGRGIPLKLLRWMDNQTLRRAAAIVVLSEDMADTVRRRGIAGNLPIHTINNFLLPSFDRAGKAPAALVKPSQKRRFIFAGNLGKFQNLDLLVEGVAACLERHPRAELLLLGEGEAKAGLEMRWGDHPQVRFGPFLPFAQAKELIAGADVGLVSLTRNIYRVSYPSKVLTYIGLGLPMLALLEPESQLAREIEQNGLGAVPAAATVPAVADAAERLLAGAADRQAVEAYHSEKCAEGRVLQQWDELFSGIGENPSARKLAAKHAFGLQPPR
jgi:glycosyltransferase involved in cell wall biosynthesis